MNSLPLINGHIGASFSLCFMYEFLFGSFLYFKREYIVTLCRTYKWLIFMLLALFTIFFEIYTYTDLIPKTGEMHTPWIGIFAAPLSILLGLTIKSRCLWLDLSFGIFLYHMVVIGLLLHFNINGVVGIVLTAAVTPVIALMSRKYVELPFLKLKK